MINDPFQFLKGFLKGECFQENTFFSEQEYPYASLIQCLKENETNFGFGDLLSFIRDIIRREQATQGNADQLLRIPKNPPWPIEKEEWNKRGIQVLNDDGEFLTIKANPWTPSWLSPKIIDYLNDVYKGVKRKTYKKILGDPFLRKMEIEHYRTEGQKAAIRGVIASPPGATILVNLPTGEGKSLVGHLPAFLESKQGSGLTVIIVPTTALALDQEKSLEKYWNHEIAYYGGAGPNEKERNRRIRERIREGTQGIVFTSPESFQGSLIAPIYSAASYGYLKRLVIDEAHIVDQWGDEFRSSFQEISGIRNDLLRILGDKPFQTILLSATITQFCLETLETLFGKPGPFKVIYDNKIRPEPSYWSSKCETDEEKEEKILETIFHSPRPLILYTTLVEDAEKWKLILNNRGYRRVGLITGKTKTEKRLEVIEKWRDDKIDIIVATSAFGLGVNKPNVRTVLHGCIPENIDRYYQEVGRGGRDGKASLSYLIYTEKDWEMSEGLNNKKLISVDRGKTRWESMFNSKKRIEGNRFRVSIEQKPGFGGKDIDMDNELNITWNLRTLTLMCRAGLIDLDSEIPIWLEEAVSGETEEEKEKKFRKMVQERKNTRVIKILDESHLSKINWKEKVEPLRKKTREHIKKAHELMGEALSSVRCMGEILEEVYSIKNKGEKFHPFNNCGGCNYCREKNIKPWFNDIHSPSKWIWEKQNFIGENLVRLFEDRSLIGIIFERSDIKNKLDQRIFFDFLKNLVKNGFFNFMTDNESLEEFKDQFAKLANPIFINSLDLPFFKWPKVPTVVFLPDKKAIKKDFLRAKKDRPYQIVFFPKDTKDPQKEHVYLKDNLKSPVFSLKEIYSEVGL